MLTIFFYIIIFILGAVMGSFVGAMAWRMYKKMDWVRGRSECEHCHHQLTVVDLVPIVSYISLRGKCRYCHKPIGKVAIRLEICTGLVFLVSALLFPSAMTKAWCNPMNILTTLNMWSSLALGLWLVCVVLLVALFTYDARWDLLPNKLVFPLIGVAFILSAVIYLGVWNEPVMTWLSNILLGQLPVAGVYLILYVMSHGKWIGFGDVKLGVAIGCLVPWWGGIIVLFVSNLLASLCSIPGMIKKKVTVASQIPFGPYLIIATYFVVLLGWVVGNKLPY